MHELAHALVRLDHDEQDPQLDYGEEERVAESVAYTVIAGGLGIDMTGASGPYLASWAERAPLATVEAAASLIDRLARRIEGALECDVARADRAEAAAWAANPATGRS